MSEIADPQEVAPTAQRAVRSESVDLVRCVRRPDDARGAAPRRVARHAQNVPPAFRPLALDAQELVTDDEDEVEAPSVGYWPVDLDVEPRCLGCDRGLGDRAL